MIRSLPRLLSPALLLFSLFVSTPALAQVPRTISFQGVLADQSGKFVADGVHRLSIRLYDSPTAGSAVYLETHDATVVRGVFNVIIGSQTPIPPSLSFDRAYFLGVSVGTGPEMSPRTPMTSVPYAMRAEVANELDPAASVVRSVNSRSGALTLQGSGATTVTQSGSTITISSSGGAGATGIQGVQNTDGTLRITNPNGPVATLGIDSGAITATHLADTSVHTRHLAPGSVSQAKLAPGLSFPPNGSAGGDLAGTYPNPTIATSAVTTAKIKDSAVTTAKIRDSAVTKDKIGDDAITTAKIVDGTIIGSDISATAALSVASLATSGGITVGNSPASARLAVRSSGTTSATNAFDVTDNAGTSLFRVRDDGLVGLGVAVPTARLDINAGNALALQILTGSMVVSNIAVVAGPAVPIPSTVSVRITNDFAPILINLALPVGIPGQILIITNDDPDPVAGPIPIASGQTRMLIFVGGVWRVVT